MRQYNRGNSPAWFLMLLLVVMLAGCTGPAQAGLASLAPVPPMPPSMVDGSDEMDEVAEAPAGPLEVVDGTWRLSATLPAGWQAETAFKYVNAAPDLDAWLASYGGAMTGEATVPGLFLGYMDFPGADLQVVEGLRNRIAVPYNCQSEQEQRSDHNAGGYLGLYYVVPCSGGDYHQALLYDPGRPSYVLMVEAYVTTLEELALLAETMATVQVAP
jgi:hypothetical protein